FSSLRQVRVLSEQWRLEYNTLRPHQSLGFVAPVEFANAS
ncbi:integrase core domain-containing protein, partial [Xanthocytophaga agilis]